MKKLLLYLCYAIVLIGSSKQLTAQDSWMCGTHDSLYNKGYDIRHFGYDLTSNAWLEKYRTPGFWTPDENTPIKTILVNWIICLKDDGTGGWVDTPKFRAGVDSMFTYVNEWYSNSLPKNYDLTCEPTIDYITDSRIRFELNEIIFINNSSFHNLFWNVNPIFDYLEQHHPDYKMAMNHIFTMPNPQPSVWGYYNIDYQYHQSHVVTAHSMYWPFVIYNTDWSNCAHVGHVVHEYGHAVGLHHTYNGEKRCVTHYDFLDDVFGLCAEPSCSCSAPYGCTDDYVCYLTYDCFWQNQPGPYPMLSGPPNNRYISPKHGGRMHRALSLFNNNFVVNNMPMHQYVKEKTSFVVPHYVMEDETWDFKIKMYQDIFVGPGATLTITNEVRMPIGGRIIVDKSARLIVDGGLITSAHDLPWQGIEVWGDNNAHQWPDAQGNYEQGYLDLNDAVIENAIDAVSLWNPGDYSTTGGIVEARNTIFKNNKRSVHAVRYINFHPVNGKEMDYRATFTHCKFELDVNYPGLETFYKHVDLDQVRGVKFTACDFSLSSDAPNVSTYNMAIGSYSAGFSVNAVCADQYIPCQHYDHSTFTGFNWAINANNTLGSTRTFFVNQALFNGNAYGIYTSGINNFSVFNSDFFIGYNDPESDPCDSDGKSASGYGIHMTGCTGFAIEENFFTKASGEPTGNYTSILCKDSETEHDIIYLNIFDGLSYGNFAEGNNRLAGDDLYGLEYQCNTNIGNNIDFIVTGGETPQIKTFQGSLSKEAGNTFSTGVQLPDGHFKNTGRQVINYFYKNNPPIHYTENYVVPIYVSGENSCSPNSGGSGSTRDAVLSDDEKQEAELKYATNLADFSNVKTLFDNLKDGGNTQGLKNEVETAWPSDMWALRAELLGKSPHLSKEVLMVASDKTDVLPEDILFEILSSNPDELRKEELISYLENKDQPLPAYMISILKQLAGGITYKTILQQDMARYNAGKTQAAYALIRSCLNDTLSDYTYLRSWLDNLDNLNADMQIVAAYLAEENYAAAQAMLDLIPATRGLEGIALVEYNDYKSMMQMQITWKQQGRTIFELDSTEVDILTGFAENTSGKAALMAKGILEYAYGHQYCNCLPVDDPAAWKSSVSLPGSEADNGLFIQAVPNPASTWVSFDFRLPVHINEAVLQITDVHGIGITSFVLTTKHGKQVWDIRDVKKGVYLYTLKAGAMSKNGKLIIQ